MTGTSVSVPVMVQWPNSLILSMIQFAPFMVMYTRRPPMMPAHACTIASVMPQLGTLGF